MLTAKVTPITHALMRLGWATVGAAAMQGTFMCKWVFFTEAKSRRAAEQRGVYWYREGRIYL